MTRGVKTGFLTGVHSGLGGSVTTATSGVSDFDVSGSDFRRGVEVNLLLGRTGVMGVTGVRGVEEEVWGEGGTTPVGLACWGKGGGLALFRSSECLVDRLRKLGSGRTVRKKDGGSVEEMRYVCVAVS